ncbi:MAG TPA: transglycosylase domain-containing protein, partial [Myxococcota bacterium]|nr:transglycosylase domain-containing protein [Myxococcota bacterium]
MKKARKNRPLGQLSRLIAWWGTILALGAVCLSLMVVAVLYSIYSEDLPEVITVKGYRPSLKSRAYAEDGQLIAEFGVESRIVVSANEIPKKVEEAFIAAEDKHFYEHHGIDFLGILSSFREFLSGKRDSLRGASTLTQQLAKGLLIKKEGFSEGSARTLSRKIKEAILALRLEQNLKKNEILWMYLNEVYLGHGSYGIGAAAQNYFKRELKDLDLGQIAILAGLPQAPSRFSPLINFNAALSRQAYVLGRMREDAFISENEQEEALKANKNLKVFERKNSFREEAPYFSEHIRRALLEQYGENVLYEEGLSIYTTLDLDREQRMQKVLKEGLIGIDKRQGFLGPIFRPENEIELNKAQKLVLKINQKNLMQMNEPYSLAFVSNVDQPSLIVHIEAKEGKGIVPLSGMSWARERNPEKNFESSRLERIGTTLKRGDVILVARKNSAPNEEAIYSLEQEPEIEGAMIAIEPSSGYVHAMHGGYSFERSEFNRTFQACRQPGSVFKPIVYAAAVALKRYTPATLVEDAPLTFRDGQHALSWKPKNFEKKYMGEVTVREAVMNSMNVPTLNVTADVGIENVVDWAH